MGMENNRQKIVETIFDYVNNKNYVSKAEVLMLIYDLAESLEISREEFEDARKAKAVKNGAFMGGYVLSEKVLPIGVETENKVIRDDKRDTESGAQKTVADTDACGIRSIPEKLVRDRIPEIIEKQAMTNWETLGKIDGPLKNYKAKTRVVSGDELKKLLMEKLEEEKTEFLAAIEKEDVIEDVGDMLEIVEHLDGL